MGRRKTHEEFVKQVYDLVGEEYTVLSEYTGSGVKVSMKHNKCGNEYKVTPSHFLKGTRCPKCFGNIKKTTEIFKQDVYSLVGDEYSLLSEYKDSKTKILI